MQFNKSVQFESTGTKLSWVGFSLFTWQCKDVFSWIPCYRAWNY